MNKVISHEHISVFDIFKIGVGPSSSHTMGPWRAAQAFIKTLHDKQLLGRVARVAVTLYGSLAKTGKGHGTDVAVMLGLAGDDPVTVEVHLIHPKVQDIKAAQKISLGGKHTIPFVYERDMIFNMKESLPYHPNGMTCRAFSESDDVLAQETYFSIGGGFVEQEGTKNTLPPDELTLPYPIAHAADALHWASHSQLPISEIVLHNELCFTPAQQLWAGVNRLWQVMRDCMYRGAHTTGVLPGGLQVQRRAQTLNAKLLPHAQYQDAEGWLAAIRAMNCGFQHTVKWVSCFALAVNEENAAFGRVVTAPTNGAAGVIPAVLAYYVCFCEGVTDESIGRFILTAAQIGSMFKKGATISAAMGGCQAEIGVSSAMAAAGLTEQLGGTPDQVLMAAEIAMEHHLGLTCDPIGGLVQIPCIERNTMGAMKAITAAQIALEGNPATARVSLDTVIRTMWQTALDMNDKYKETAEGGLAANIPISLAEC